MPDALLVSIGVRVGVAEHAGSLGTYRKIWRTILFEDFVVQKPFQLVFDFQVLPNFSTRLGILLPTRLPSFYVLVPILVWGYRYTHEETTFF